MTALTQIGHAVIQVRHIVRAYRSDFEQHHTA
jgi:hypothetical protein